MPPTQRKRILPHERHRTLAERDALVLQYIPLAHRVVGDLAKYLPYARDSREDAVAHATVALVRAAQDWDAAGSATFKTFAYHYCKREVWHAAAREGSLVRVPHHAFWKRANRPFLAQALKATRRLPRADPPARREPCPDAALDVAALLAGLRRQEREALWLRFAEGLPLKEVGRRIGLSGWGANAVIERSVVRLLKARRGGVMLSPEVLAVLAGERPWAVQCGDALELLPLLPAGCVGAVVTDPPYGIGFDRATWEDAPADYPVFIKALVAECQRVVTAGWCFVFQAMLNVARFAEWFPERFRIFAACKNFSQIRHGVWHSWDPVVFWHNGPRPGSSHGPVNRDFCVGNVSGAFGDDNGHPCPRPLDTMRHVVQLAAPAGGCILDPFSGSATTLVAAVQTGRRGIGFEISEQYAALSRRRLERAEREQKEMLFPAADAPRQRDFTEGA